MFGYYFEDLVDAFVSENNFGGFDKSLIIFLICLCYCNFIIGNKKLRDDIRDF